MTVFEVIYASVSARGVYILEINGSAETVGLECRFHDLHATAELIVSDELLLATVDGGDEITVEIVNIGLKAGNDLLLGGL